MVLKMAQKNDNQRASLGFVTNQIYAPQMRFPKDILSPFLYFIT